MPVTTLRAKAYRHLRNRLASGQLTAGTQLIEPVLAKELGMSRTPVREALRQMEMEGFVECFPRFGVVVRVPTRDELIEMFGMREALESYAVAEAAKKISDEQLTKMVKLQSKMTEITATFEASGEEHLKGDLLNHYLMADMAFHRQMFLSSGNGYMAKTIEDTHLLSRIFRNELWIYDLPTLEESNDFHARIFQTLQQHDAEAARKIIIEAMQVAKRNVLKKYDEQQEKNENDPYEI
ncbi:Transcriptional regulator, GntR family [hydrothermal vent metagenome]|uniref:Transcriptional regulator, GntR family n=1 Tax=hydrothermal vent metagenome TaxID=652676 RepID=A0A3B1DG70_9ZZZZ